MVRIFHLKQRFKFTSSIAQKKNNFLIIMAQLKIMNKQQHKSHTAQVATDRESFYQLVLMVASSVNANHTL